MIFLTHSEAYYARIHMPAILDLTLDIANNNVDNDDAVMMMMMMMMIS